MDEMTITSKDGRLRDEPDVVIVETKMAEYRFTRMSEDTLKLEEVITQAVFDDFGEYRGRKVATLPDDIVETLIAAGFCKMVKTGTHAIAGQMTLEKVESRLEGEEKT